MIKTFFKTLLATLAVCVFALGPTQTSNATDWFYAVKELGLDTAARAIARIVFQRLTDGLIEQIQGGGTDGGASFVQSWRNFLSDAEYRGEDIFRSILAATNTCDEFEEALQDVYNVDQAVQLAGQRTRVSNLDPYALRGNCTLPANFDADNYSENFGANGGWQAYLRIAQPQNNFLGSFVEAGAELGLQRALEKEGDLSEAVAGSGYTSYRDACQGEGSGARCVLLGQVVTPASLLSQSVASTIDQDFNWLTGSDEISEIMIAVIYATVNRMVSLATAPTVEASQGDVTLSNFEESLKEEYCSATVPSDGAIARNGAIFYAYVQQRVGAAPEEWGSLWADLSDCGNGTTRSGGLFGHSCNQGPCERARNQDNPYPYQRCVNACFKALERIPEEVLVAEPGAYSPAVSTQPQNPGDVCATPNASTSDPSATDGFWCDNDPFSVAGSPTEVVLNCSGNPGTAFITGNMENCNQRPDQGTPGWTFGPDGRPLDFAGNPVQFLYEVQCPGSLVVTLPPGNYSVGAWTQDPSTAVYACPAFAANPGDPNDPNTP
jgi:hypothetical protein